MVMDIKQYIDYFDDISHLERSKQFSLIENACEQVHQKYKFPILTVLPHIIRILMLVIICGGSYVLFAGAVWALVVSFLVGIIVARVVITEIKDSLILKALKNNLQNES